MRLIDADAFIERIKKDPLFPLVERFGLTGVIETQPTVDPVKHGRWIEENRRSKSSQFYCSECHRTAYDIQPSRKKDWTKRCRYAYCPNCGAYMLDEEKE